MAYRIKILNADRSLYKVVTSNSPEQPIDAVLRLRKEYPDKNIVPMGQPDLTPPSATAFDLKG